MGFKELASSEVFTPSSKDMFKAWTSTEPSPEPPSIFKNSSFSALATPGAAPSLFKDVSFSSFAPPPLVRAESTQLPLPLLTKEDSFSQLAPLPTLQRSFDS